MPLPEMMTATELGELLGISGRSVRDLAARGIIPRAPKARYHVRDAVKGYTSHLRETAALRGGDDATSAARRREAEARALKLELANAKARGDLVSRDDVAATWAGILVDVRAALTAVPTRIPELPKMMARRVDEEIRAALERLSDA